MCIRDRARSAGRVALRFLTRLMSVSLFAAEHVPLLGEMNPDLMGSPGFEPALDQTVGLVADCETLEGFDMRDCLLRLVSRFAERRASPKAVATVADEPRVDRLLLGFAVHHSDVGPLDLVLAEAVSYTHLRAHETPEHLVCR